MAVFYSTAMSTSNKYIKYRVRVSEISQNIESSYSRCNVQIQAWRTNTGYETYGNGTAYLYIGNNTYTQAITTDDKIKYNSYTVLLSKLVDIPRGELGNAATNIYAKFNIGSAVTSNTQGYTFHLTPINRYAIISSADNFTDESYPSITYTNPAGTEMVTNLKARITWEDIYGNEQATDYVNLNDEGGTYTFDASSLTAQNISDMLDACPDSNSLSVTFDLQSTMNETDYHHYKDATMQVVNANPVFTTGISYADANPNVVAITGSNQIIVQKQSELRIYVGQAQAQKGSSLIEHPYKITFNGQEYIVTGYLPISMPDLVGTYKAVLSATDSRGNVGTSEIDITIEGWQKPYAESFSWMRQNNFEPTTILNVNADYSSVTGNILTITEKHRKIIDPTPAWSQETVVQDNTDTTISNLDSEYEWEMVITVSDSFDSETYSAQIGKGIPLFFLDAFHSSASMNCFPDDDKQMKIGGTLKVKPNDTDAGIILPHSYSTSEQIVGYWINGSPIYEKTISYSTTISSGGNITVPSNLWSQKAQPVDIVLYSTSTASKLVWRFVTAQVNSSGVLQIFNGRAATLTFDTFTIQYIKL